MYNPITAGRKGGIVEMSHRNSNSAFYRKQQHILQLPVKIVEAVEQLPQQGFDSVEANVGVQLLPVMPDNLLRFVWLVWIIN